MRARENLRALAADAQNMGLYELTGTPDAAPPSDTVWWCRDARAYVRAPHNFPCAQARCAVHRIPDCSPLLNGCSWQPPARQSDDLAQASDAPARYEPRAETAE